MAPFDARIRRVALFTTLLVLGLALARTIDPLPEGLSASYFSDVRWDSPIVRSTIDGALSTDGLIAGWRGEPPERFSTAWNGSFAVLRAGTYTFATRSDDGSWVYVDGRPVVDNGGNHSTQLVQGSLPLERGVHTIFVRYYQNGGPFHFELLWARDASSLVPVPAWILSTRHVAFVRFLGSIVLRRAVSWTAWLWLGLALVMVGSAMWKALGRYIAAPFVPSADSILLLIGVAMLLLVLPHEIESDGRARYYALAKLIEWHEVSQIPYSLIGPLFSTPLYFLGKVFLTSEWWCARFNTLVFAAGLGVAHRLLRTRVDRAVLEKFLLLLVAASMFPYHVEGYFAEVFTAVLVGVGLLAASVGYPLSGWTAAAIGVANTPATLAALSAAALQHTWQTRRLRSLFPVFVAAAFIMAESWIRRGTPFASGYEGNHGDATALTYSGRPGFSYPLLFGILSILFSFGKGIAFYAPALFLSIRRRVECLGEAVSGCFGLWMAFLVGLILVYAKWWAWYGGLYWGPRFFLFASIPACLALAVGVAGFRKATSPRLLSVFAVLTLSSWVAIDGAVFGFSALGLCRDTNYEWVCLYVPEYSALWRPFVEFSRPPVSRAAIGVYFCAVYLWLAAPLAIDISRRGRTLLADVVRTRARPASWRL